MFAPTPTSASAEGSCWVEPGTRNAYPMSYPAYCRTRESEEKAPPRHRGLGPEIDRYVWQRWRGAAAPQIEVLLTFRPGAPPRVRRIVAEILRAIRRGQPASEAIRHVSRRFGLRHTRTREFIMACVDFQMRARPEPGFAVAHWSPTSTPGDWV
jgi:hypothetical protein